MKYQTFGPLEYPDKKIHLDKILNFKKKIFNKFWINKRFILKKKIIKNLKI